MTTHGSCYELTATRTAGGTADRPDRVVMGDPVSIAGSATGTSAPLPIRSPIPLSAYTPFLPVKLVRAQPTTENAVDRMMIEGAPTQVDIQVNGPLTDNNSSFGVLRTFESALAIPRGRLSPGIFLRTGGAVQTAINNLTGTVDNWVVQTIDGYSSQNGYVGQAHFVDFESSPPATGGSSSEAANLLAQLSDGGYRVSLGTANGTEVFANNCALAGLAPEGAIFIRPEDLGNGDGQIPQAVGANQALRFRFHPSVFIRRSQYWNSIVRRAYDSVDIAAEELGQPVRIVTVDAAPTASNWLFQIDGQMTPVTIQHPAGSDYRRPRDIWNSVIVPAIEGSSSARLAITIGIPGSSQTSVGVLSKLAYLEYARCLPLSGTEVTQDDTAPVG